MPAYRRGYRTQTHPRITYLDQIAGDIPAGDIQPPGEVRQREAFVYWANVSDSIPRIHHHTGQQPWKVERRSRIRSCRLRLRLSREHKRWLHNSRESCVENKPGNPAASPTSTDPPAL